MVTLDSLDQLAAIARAAGLAILDAAAGDLDVTVKTEPASGGRQARVSPVSRADHAAHAVIERELAAWDPRIPVVSEEGVIAPFADRRSWTRFWLVDPLDGTKEFLNGSGEYTVNIALIEGDAPILGVVHAPALNLMYTAGRGLGAWKTEGATRVRLYSAAPSPAGPFVIAESRSHPSPELEAFLKTIPVKARVAAGSSLKFCWIAEGKADLYPRFGPTMEWDTAAGDCVFRYSGRGPDRRSPLKYNTPTLRHEQFVIGSPEVTG